ncbi:MAG: fused acetyl/propionyl-CoA carboxylase subunit alpha/methylmalonyl-CoA decarboxylase subunit alpha [Actinobacteria bacterium]|nr:fused acetyl/propionyl-CoA carboxylase subunit alpha/methylmalonyl-CoA decarboxylase subunit alpha [Actinomycetota bacterium]
MELRVAIINRGEPARRVIRAAHELNHERDWDIRTIALHTQAERTATFVREADEAFRIGGSGIENPYLDHAELERALVETGAEAAWVGWGFVAEDPAFVDLCDRLGVVFIGPSGDVMRRLGDKIAAKQLAEEVGVPVAPWSGGAVTDEVDAIAHGARIGYPLMIKAAAGGGGRGIRKVLSEDELLPAIARARAEARSAFRDDRVLMERVIEGARHVEVQIMADGHGQAWPVGIRDCSVQRRSQKVIEESWAPGITPELEAALSDAAVALVNAVGYKNAGTVEFLLDPATGAFTFLEVNPRLQVEHPVTEKVTGLDLVKMQIEVAMGGHLAGERPSGRGHAIEARLNAEDPQRGFAPAPGRVQLLSIPTGPGVRVDTGLAEGDDIPPEYDSMIAKVVAWGVDRDEARARLMCALQEMAVVVEGGTTNRAFLLDILGRPEMVQGTADTAWLDRLAGNGELHPDRYADVAVLSAAVDAYETEERLEQEHFYATAQRGRPETSDETGHLVELRHRTHLYRLHVARTGPKNYRVTGADGGADVVVERLGRFVSRVRVGDAVHRVVSAFHAPDHVLEVDGFAHRISRDEGGLVRSPAPAVVVSVSVSAGDVVRAGDPVAVIESMKMESTVTAAFDGVVTDVLVTGGIQVNAGAPLLRLEGVVSSEETWDVPRLAFDALTHPGESPSGPRRRRAVFGAIRSLLLGFDIAGDDARKLVDGLRVIREEAGVGDPLIIREQLHALRVFVDLAELARNRPPAEAELLTEEQVHSPREHFHHYLRSLNAEHEGVPAPTRRALQRALAHYGIDEISERTPELATSAHRIYLSLERVGVQFPVIAALLDALTGDAEHMAPALRSELHETLSRMVVATQLRHPAIGEMARGARYATFDRPLIAAGREATYDRARTALNGLADDPGNTEHMAVLVELPQPLMPLLGPRLSANGGLTVEPLLEALTRRHYRIRDLHDVVVGSRDGVQMVTGAYTRPGHLVSLVAMLTDQKHLESTLRSAAQQASESSTDGHDVVIDIYVHWPGEKAPDAKAAMIERAIAAAGFPRTVSRLVVSPAAPDGTASHFTFRRDDDGALAEERATRGMHPMIARRLRFWRLNPFEVERIESTGDTYAFRCVTPGAPRDERFVALAEVRNLTEVRDDAGTLITLPELEHALADSLEAIRRAQVSRPQRSRPLGNHVLLYVWPPITFPVQELTALARRLAPMTEGLGLEEVLVCGSSASEGAEAGDVALRFAYRPGSGVTVGFTSTPSQPLSTQDDYNQKVLAARRRGTVYPYELANLLAGVGGSFEELDLDDEGQLAPVDRAPGGNSAGIVAGLATTPTDKYPEGVRRVVLIGDPTKSLGSVSEPECARIMAAIDMADRERIPVEWFALSSGARISRDTGTENMDWVSRVLRRIINFTQDGGEINVVVAGINVGAQPYWNAEATMLMHTRGILVMTPDSAMVLTGKQALDYSGGVSADDNFGIGGYDRIMGPNGQAQYWAPHLAGACELLFEYYDHTYVAPGEDAPRRAETSDPLDRDVRPFPHNHPESDFTTVGDIFSADRNPERKKPFDIRTVIRAVSDQDHDLLERWRDLGDGDTVVVMDGHLGGYPVMMLGIESRNIPRRQFVPADGPDQWTAGTLFPVSSRKAARAINAASGNRPLVVLANLTGFDGSPESLRKRQLEYGAEIGRAIVNFDGPIVFCVVSRYHGGAFVVFSAALNERMEVLAVEGSYASVIGGAPAAAVVFAGDVKARTEADQRIVDAVARLEDADGVERSRLSQELAELRIRVRSEKLGEVADEFDNIHSVERARDVGSVHAIIPANELRPRLIDAVERGLAG